MFSIIVPVYNEEAILEASISRLYSYVSAHLPNFEILIVNNGSTDKTEEIGRNIEHKFPSVRFFSVALRGPGLAFRTGVVEARGEFVITLDVDLSSDLVFIDLARDLLAYFDMVVGCKTMGTQRRTLLRVAASQTYIFFAQFLLDLSIADYSIGVKAVRRSSILEVLDYLDTWTGFILELVLYLRKHGRRVVQVGVDCEDKRVSRFSLLWEAYYRGWHLFQARKILANPASWFSIPPSNSAG